LKINSIDAKKVLKIKPEKIFRFFVTLLNYAISVVSKFVFNLVKSKYAILCLPQQQTMNITMTNKISFCGVKKVQSDT
jgi:hypothetical protein